MGLQPSEVRQLTMPQFLLIADAFSRAHSPRGKGAVPSTPSDAVAALVKRAEATL
jgi:hypothetical protein